MALSEIAQIVDVIESRLKPLDALIEIATKSVKTMYQYRTRLIADVVTGKLDVREAAAAAAGGDRGSPSLSTKPTIGVDMEQGTADDGSDVLEEAEA